MGLKQWAAETLGIGPMAGVPRDAHVVSLAQVIGGMDGGGGPSSRDVSSYWRLFKENGTVNTAVMETVRALIGIPWQAERYDADSGRWQVEPLDSPFARFMTSPNRKMNPVKLFERFHTETTVTGNGLLWLRKDGAGKPIGLWPMDSRFVTVEPSGESIIGAYRFDPNQVVGTGELMRSGGVASRDATPYAPEEVIHVQLAMDPDFPLWGLSPMSAALTAIDLDISITEFATAFFRNGATPSHMFTTETEINDEEVRRLERRWQQQRAGTETSWGLWVVDGTKGSLSKMGLSTGSREIGMFDLRKQVEALILAAFNVPPIVVGAVVGLENATYSNYEQARAAMHEENTDPNLKRIAAEFTLKIAGAWEDWEERSTGIRPLLRCMPDLTHVMALEPYNDSRERRILASVQGTLRKQNEGRAELGLPSVEGGDTFLQSLAVTATEQPDPDPNDRDEPEDPALAERRPISHNRERRLRRILAAGSARPEDLDAIGVELGAQVSRSLATLYGGRVPDGALGVAMAALDTQELAINPDRDYAQAARRLLMAAHRAAGDAWALDNGD